MLNDVFRAGGARHGNPETTHPSPCERLDEALEETFPASDPIAVDPAEPMREHTRPEQTTEAPPAH